MAENTQLQYLWRQISERAKNLITPISYDHLIKNLEPVDITGRKIILKCSSDLNASTLMNKLADKLRETDLNMLSPYEAMTLLFELKKML